MVLSDPEHIHAGLVGDDRLRDDVPDHVCVRLQLAVRPPRDVPECIQTKLDFLLQEMNREINTVGAKADGLRISELIIGAKAELEKMREQVQNVE